MFFVALVDETNKFGVFVFDESNKQLLEVEVDTRKFASVKTMCISKIKEWFSLQQKTLNLQLGPPYWCIVFNVQQRL